MDAAAFWSSVAVVMAFATLPLGIMQFARLLTLQRGLNPPAEGARDTELFARSQGEDAVAVAVAAQALDPARAGDRRTADRDEAVPGEPLLHLLERRADHVPGMLREQADIIAL